MRQYIFARSWHVPLGINKIEESIVDVEGCNDLQLLVDQAKDAAKTDIEDFICKYRQSLEAILHRDISDGHKIEGAHNDTVDLFDCLAIPRPNSKRVQEIPVKTPAKRKAQSTYLEEHAEESQGENLPRCHLLLPRSATFLEDYPDDLSYRLCPISPSRDICLSFTNEYIVKMLTNIDHFYVNSSRLRRQTVEEAEVQKTRLQRLSESGIKASWKAYSSQEYLTRKRGDAFNFIFNVGIHATTNNKENGNIITKRLEYSRRLRKTIRGTLLPRYTSKTIFYTDGKTFLPEVRTLAKRLKEQKYEEPSAIIDNYDGVVGLDLGETYAAASFFLPTDTARQGTQLTIKRDELYCKNKMNAIWLQDRKSKCGIDEDEAALACGSCIQKGKASFSKYLKRSIASGDKEVIRILVCDASGGIFHRDGNAAQNIPSIASSMLTHGKRPTCFIRPPRRLPLQQ
ncbi:hypothetical protein DFQ30_008296 [Apophysomyces sp. BC1015]|nr:hypothetical protein DFQ30_008296 [Apophysomyces sp. BC1015]